MERYETVHEAITQAPSRNWSRGGVGGTLYEITKVAKERRHLKDVLAVDVRVSNGGVVVYDDRHIFPNPPLRAIVNGVAVDNPLLAIQQVLERSVARRTDGFRIRRLNRIGNTDTFTGDVLTAFAVDDGYIACEPSTWSAAQAGTPPITAATTGTTLSMAVWRQPTYHRIDLAYMRFDTSGIAAGDTINSYTLSLFGQGSAEANSYSTTLQARVHSGYGAGDITTADWVNCATIWSTLTLFATFTVSGWNQTAGVENAFTSQGASNQINIDGNTDIVVGHSNISGSQPSSVGTGTVLCRASEQAGTSSDPALEIDYTPAPQFLVPDPVALTLTVAAPTVVGGADLLAPDPVALTLTVPEVGFIDVVKYERIEQQSWSGDIFNRIQAGVSPYSVGEEAVVWTDAGPYMLSSGQSVELTAVPTDLIATYTGHTRDVDPQTSPTPVVQSVNTQSFAAATSYAVTLPGTVNADELLLVLLAVASSSTPISAPAGWTRKLAHLGGMQLAVFVRLADGSEDGTPVTFTNSGSSAAAAKVYRISNWAEDINDTGVLVAAGAAGTNAAPNPPNVNWGWGELPTLVIATYASATGNDPSGYPSSYTNSSYIESGTSVNLASARRSITGANATDPGNFTATAGFWIAATIAIRGPLVGGGVVTSGDPGGSSGRFTISYDVAIGGTTQAHTNIQVTGIPILQGDEQVVEVNDVDSQDTHGLSTYRNPAQLFRSTGDALTYANLVLERYKDRHPVLRIGFTATKSTPYYNQVKALRVGDRVSLTATNNAGLGIAQDFWIESIHLRASQGLTLIEVEYELSPVTL